VTRALERGRQARNETRNPAGNGSGSMVAAVEFGAVVARTSTTWPTTRLSRRPTQGRVDPKQDANCGVVGTLSAAGLAEGLLAPLTPSAGGEMELLRTGGWGHKPGDTAVNASFDARLVCWAAARWCYFSRLGRIAAPSSGCRGVLLLLVKHSSWASHDVGVTTSAFLFFFVSQNVTLSRGPDRLVRGPHCPLLAWPTPACLGWMRHPVSCHRPLLLRAARELCGTSRREDSTRGFV